MPNNPAILDGKKKDVFSNHFKSFSNLGRFYSADQCQATARMGERTGDTDACFSTDFCGFRCVRRATPEELQQLKVSK